MNRTNLFSLIAAVLFSITLNAQVPEPTPEPEVDPTLPNKTEVLCGGTMVFSSGEYGATRDSNTGNPFKLKPVSGASDRRAQTGGVVKLERNHEFAFSLTWVPKASQLVRGEDVMTMTVRYQRRDDAGKIKVLAETLTTSDLLTNFGELHGRRVDLAVRAKFVNPEVSTIQANHGQVPDGMTTNGSFDCYMRVGKTEELR